MNRVELSPGYSIPPIISGCWQLAGGHGGFDRDTLFKGMFQLIEAGLNTFDCADIYTGVEQLLGEFRNYCNNRSPELARTLQVHTKYVPDLDSLSSLNGSAITSTIDRSLTRLGVDTLDLVQFHWWDLEIPGYVDAALELEKLKSEGKIRNIGVTNFATQQIEEMLSAGVCIVSSQVQYSFLDRRPQLDMLTSAKQHNYKLLCYGTLAGGFLSSKWLDVKDPGFEDENRSLVKYRLIIEDFGGWDKFQQLLQALSNVSTKCGLSISELAILFPLNSEGVASAITGVRSTRHTESAMRLASSSYAREGLAELQEIAEQISGISGRIYDRERDISGKHGRIMKYNLNTQDRKN